MRNAWNFSVARISSLSAPTAWMLRLCRITRWRCEFAEASKWGRRENEGVREGTGRKEGVKGKERKGEERR